MSNINTSITVNHQSTGTSASNSTSVASFDVSASIESKQLTTTPVVLAPSFFKIPKSFFVRNLSGDDILLSFDDDTTYPISIKELESTFVSLDTSDNPTKSETSVIVAEADTEGDQAGLYFDLTDQSGFPVRVWLNTGPVNQVSTITTRADSSSDLDGTYFTLEGNSGTWAIWNDVGSTGTSEPSHGEDNSVEVTDIVADDTASSVAAATYSSLINDSAFFADFSIEYTVGEDSITITDKFTGGRAVIADGVGAEATSYTLATPTNGHSSSSEPSEPVTTPAGSGRLLPVSTVVNATAIENAVAIASALDEDDQFSCPVPTTATLTVTDLYIGTRTIITDGNTTWTLSRSVAGTDLPVVYAKSKGVTQAQLFAIPN